jgi:hypothetical protein
LDCPIAKALVGTTPCKPFTWRTIYGIHNYL